MICRRSIIHLVLFFLIVTSTKISSQSENSDLDSNSVSEKENVFDVYFINGYALGYMLFSNTNSEIRILLDVSSSYTKETEDRTHSTSTMGTVPPNQSTEKENGLTSISLSSQYLLTFYQSKIGESYFGIGPFIGYQKYNYLSSATEGNYISEADSKRDEYTLGLTALVGIRSTLNKTVSIYAETQISGGINWETGENGNNYYNNGILDSNYKGEVESDGWYHRLTFVRIGIRFNI